MQTSFNNETSETKIETKDESKIEFIMRENDREFTLIPIKHHDIWELVNKQKEMIWHENKIQYSKDVLSWTTECDEKTRNYIKVILSFFATADAIVMKNVSDFRSLIQIPEIKGFYVTQEHMEFTHSLVYQYFLNAFISDHKERQDLLHGMKYIPAVQKKAEWAMKWIDRTKSIGTRILAFVIVELIFFSGSFCSIYWIREQQKLHEFCISNDYIARDEGLHCDFGILLFNKYIQYKPSESEIVTMIEEAVVTEINFINYALREKLIGMNSDLMSEHIKCVADYLCNRIKIKPIYGVKESPFPFMKNIIIFAKENFLEQHATNYKFDLSKKDEIDVTSLDYDQDI